MMMTFKAIKDAITIDRTTRVWNALQPHISIIQSKGTQKQNKDALVHIEKIKKLKGRIRIMKYSVVTCYLLLYISVISTLLQPIFIVNVVVEKLSVISSLFGSSLLLIAIIILTRLINIYVSDAHLIADNIVSLGTFLKYQK